MSRDLYILNRDPDLHLRDARHAYQLFTEHSFALSPKVKFLYHVNFALTPEAVGKSPNSSSYNREIGVLAKSADLPSYTANVETKNQYNRKKNIQTRIDYNEVAIRFHDDNTGLTRAMLEEYYKYYVVDGRRADPGDVSPRDTYNQQVKRYGLDNETTVPFFKYIKLFQLSRQEWFSYTLINPLITQWSHDSVDSSDGQGIMENSISVAYESVFYDQGSISPGGDPAGFAAQETRYDLVSSPLTVLSPDGIPGGNTSPPGPKLINLQFQNEAPVIDRYSNSFSLRGVGAQQFDQTPRLPSVIAQTEIPKTNTQTRPTVVAINSRTQQIGDADLIVVELNRNPKALAALVKKVLATGSYSADWNSRNFDKFISLSPAEQDTIRARILSKIAVNKKYQQFADQIIIASRS